MASVKFDLKNFEQFMVKFLNMGVNVEEACNLYLHEKGYKLTESEIYRLMPRSNENRKGKKHAKNTTSLKPVLVNLGFEITTQRKFNYLVFPNDALGTAIRNKPKEFFEYGLGNTEEKIIKQLAESLEEAIERSL